MSEIEYQEKRLDEIFKCQKNGDSKLTKAYCDSHKGNYEVFTGTTIGHFAFIDTWQFDKPCLSFTKDGEHAGTIKIIYNDKYNIGSHRSILFPTVENIDLEYCYHCLKDKLFPRVKRGQVPSVNWDQIKDIKIKLPITNNIINKQIQKEIALKYKEIEEKKEILLNKANKLEKLTISFNHNIELQKPMKISNLISYMSGNSGLTKKTLENTKNIPDDQKIIVLSGSTKLETPMGYVSQDYLLPNGKRIKVFENQEGIHVTRKGDAGILHFLAKGKYTLNDDAYILYINNMYKESIDTRWLSYSMQNESLKYLTTQEGNKTWSIKNFMEKGIINIPIKTDGTFDLEKQKEIANKYATIENIKSNLSAQIKELISIIIK